ncbi:MarR family winged helix-turn-helix transcriptional regulator [Desulfatitalea alkaliphila]|uniref:MarR family transcriptional regulator n=1 Tax=Desulfatitalea alkaliphila TaxID=2929485 RepID=A0AA41UJ97_9BACT|nr:MarR family transcriptional regulator [Desulfatitalea alkaliphila]MCJ8501660.1 MarR family transcriptional regulator [Desulfatitalea alkaliphila]
MPPLLTSENRTDTQPQMHREMLASLRKITQAISLHSRDLQRRYGLTGPQLILLNEIARHAEISVSELARLISVSQATVTEVLNRLEKMGLVTKSRDTRDKRRIMITTTPDCDQILDSAPPPLQEAFIERFAKLEQWEQLMILAALKRVVHLMSAEQIEAAPLFDAKANSTF